MDVAAAVSRARAGAPEARASLRSLHARAKRGYPPSRPIVQFPNAPALVAAGSLLIARSTSGAGHAYALAGVYGATSAWGWLELTDGASPPRRVLGAAALAVAVVRVGEALPPRRR